MVLGSQITPPCGLEREAALSKPPQGVLARMRCAANAKRCRNAPAFDGACLRKLLMGETPQPRRADRRLRRLAGISPRTALSRCCDRWSVLLCPRELVSIGTTLHWQKLPEPSTGRANCRHWFCDLKRRIATSVDLRFTTWRFYSVT